MEAEGARTRRKAERVVSEENNTGARKFPKSLEIAAESVCFLLVQYFLACFMLSMRASLVYIIVFAANVFVLIKYGETLARLTESRMPRAAIFVLYLAALAASVYFFGYFPVSPERAELPL